jgi:hypothetical protein
MDLFTSLLVKAISGILYVAYLLAWHLFRVAWWLSLYLLLSLGSGVIWLARGGRGRPADTGRFGRYLQDRQLWQDAASGTAYPVSAAGCEYCEVIAELSGQYWRRTMLNRLLRRGALWRYKLSAVVIGGGPETVAAWCEFPSEAWKRVTLDDLALAGGPVPGIDPDALNYNRAEAQAALDHLEVLLDGRGWKRCEDPSGQPPDPWYAIRFSRSAIAWDAPVAAPTPSGQALEQPPEHAGGQQ